MPEAANQIPLRDFFKNPEKTSYQISYNGKYVSYLAPFNNRLNIYVQQIGDDTPKVSGFAKPWPNTWSAGES